MSSSFYSPRYGCWVVFPGFFFLPKQCLLCFHSLKIQCVNSAGCTLLQSFSLHVTQDLRGVGDFGAVCKTGKTPLSETGLQSDICGKASFILSLFCFGLGFFPSYKKFFLMFGINGTRYERGSDNRQVLLCLFIKSTSSSFTFTFCITEYFYFFFCLAFLQILFLPNSISTTCTILHELLALQLVVLSCTSERSPEHMGVGCLCSRAELCAWHHVQAGLWLWVLQQWRNNSAFYCI